MFYYIWENNITFYTPLLETNLELLMIAVHNIVLMTMSLRRNNNNIIVSKTTA